jgi:hypothetical protein
LAKGARSSGWDFSPNHQRAVQDGHANVPLLVDLARVISEGADPSILEQYPEWQAA